MTTYKYWIYKRNNTVLYSFKCIMDAICWWRWKEVFLMDSFSLVPYTSSHSSGLYMNCSWFWPCCGGTNGSWKLHCLLVLVWSTSGWQWGDNMVGWWATLQVGIYSPKRAGVRLGVMGASSFLPGVQIFTALKERKVGEMSFIHFDNIHEIVHTILWLFSWTF